MKSWKKLITRLTKTFKISNDLTPNLNRKRNISALNFLIHKRFIENSFGKPQLSVEGSWGFFLIQFIVGEESWKEMVQEAVGTEEHLQKELVCQVAQYGDLEEALKWAHFYNIDKNDWPYGLRMLEEYPEGDR